MSSSGSLNSPERRLLSGDGDVLKLHQSVVEQFQADLAKIPAMEHTLAELERIDVTKLSPFAAKKVEQDKGDLSQELQATQYAFNYNFYLLEITPLLSEYRKQLNKPMRVSFMGVPIKDVNDRRTELVERICAVIMRYTNTLPQHETADSDPVCRNCKQSLHNHIAYQSKIICTGCGNEDECSEYVSGYKDNERVSMVSKYSYNRRIHFKDCMYQFQGKQKSVIPQRVIDMLSDQCVRLGLVHPNEALSRAQRFSKVTWHHISMLLKDNSLSNYYEDVYLIYHKVTGKRLHDISHLEDKLINDFDVLSELYDTIYISDKHFTRRNFISMSYVLFQLLRRYGYPCSRSDFNFIKTPTRQGEHDMICGTLFKHLGWNFTALW